MLALVAFAASAYLQSKGYKEPKVNFMVFVGVTAWLLAMFYAVVSCSEGLQRTFWGAVEVAVNAVWVVFFLAAAASYASFKACKPSQIDITEPFTECGGWLASEAFAWMRCVAFVWGGCGGGCGGGGARRGTYGKRAPGPASFFNPTPPDPLSLPPPPPSPPPLQSPPTLSWLLWIPSLVISVVDMRRGEGITGGGKRYPVGTPA